MANQSVETGPNPSESPAASSAAPPSAPALPAFRFGLRQLFWTVSIASVVIAAVAIVPRGPAPLLLVIAALIVAAHVAGTALGSRLRKHANESRAWYAQHAQAAGNLSSDAAEHSCDLAAAPLPPTSPWYRRGSTSLGWLPKLVICGAVVGGCAGVALFVSDAISSHTTLAGAIVGAISVAVLGAWLAFVGGSFYAIFRHGLREAMAEQRRDELNIMVRR